MTQTNTNNISGTTAKKASTPHVRLTAEEVRQGWIDGHFSASGYLYYLIRSLRKDGWWYRIGNVTQFCKQWEIPRRTFYNAKAKLIREGKLEERMGGRVDLRVPPLSNIIEMPEKKVVLDTPKIEDKVVPPLAQLHPGNRATAGTLCYEDLAGTQVNTPENHSEQAIQQLAQSPTDLSSDLNTDLSHRAPDPPRIRRERESECFDKEGELQPGFRDFLSRIMNRLPNKPVMEEKWIRKQAKDPDNQHQYLRSLQTTSDPLHYAKADSQSIFTMSAQVCEAAYQRGDYSTITLQLQQLWSDGWRNAVMDLCATYPQWGINITLNGIQERLDAPSPAKLNQIPTPPIKASQEAFKPAFVDLSDLLASIDCQMRRLHWSREDLNRHIQATYGKVSRHRLTDEELYDLHDGLRQLDAAYAS